MTMSVRRVSRRLRRAPREARRGPGRSFFAVRRPRQGMEKAFRAIRRALDNTRRPRRDTKRRLCDTTTRFRRKGPPLSNPPALGYQWPAGQVCRRSREYCWYCWLPLTAFDHEPI